MLWSLNSRRVIADSDSVLDHNKAAAEVARPDAYIILDKNRAPRSQFSVEPGGELANQQFQVMQESKQEIAEASGIHKSMQGQQSGANSGLAINSLIEQGLNTLAEINDNFRYSRRLVGEMLFELVKENMGGRPVSVSLGEGRQKKIITLNQMAQDPQTGQVVCINDVSKVRAKVVLDDVPSTPTYKMQQLQMLTEITKALPPNLQAAMADIVVEATDLPKRHIVADRIRAAAGIMDAEQQQAAMQEQKNKQAVMEDMASKMFVLDAAEKAAKIRKTNAEAEKVLNEAQNARFQPVVRTPQIAVQPPLLGDAIGQPPQQFQ
jgi:hypothetical protein